MKKANDLLNSFFDEVQTKQGIAYNNFHNSWKKIAGEKIGLNSSIKDIDNGFLIIEIDHPGWKQLISLKEKHIIRTINKKFPELCVKKIKYHFKNSDKKALKEKILPVKKKKGIDSVDNTEFYELLKKMNKRSEE